MILRNDCRALFNSSDLKKTTYKTEITISKEDESYLNICKAEIKTAITNGIKSLKKNNNENLGMVSSPRFAQQGSYVYKTLNKPAYPPTQQLDLDYGVYLPFSNMLENGEPSKAANIFFAIIDEILESYISLNNKPWKVCKEKSSCSRVVLDDRMHIDLPLYACPDEEMDRVTEAFVSQKLKSEVASANGVTIDDFNQLNSDLIYLAKRNGEWIQSDALILRDWVKQKCNAFDNNDVRYACRFLKGWRDERQDWRDGGGPSSILLLALTMDLFNNDLDGIHWKLYEITSRLSSRLDSPVYIPTSSRTKENLLDRLSEEEISKLKESFKALNATYLQALMTENRSEANKILKNLFGERFPYRPEDIVVNNTPISPDDVRNTPASPSPARFPDTTTSGS